VQDEAASFGELLRRCREHAAISQEELAERAGLTAHAISALERGLRRRPYPHTVQALATALGLSNDERVAFTAAARRSNPGPAAPSAASPLEARRTNLPHPPNALIGRERDVEAVGGLLLRDDARLVSLTGVGGSGKTRLALADEPDAPSGSRHLPLTRRERDVARLIARGLNDRQIADALTITVSTVGAHVHRILTKLGLRSRWQIADWTMAHDPDDLRTAGQ